MIFANKKWLAVNCMNNRVKVFVRTALDSTFSIIDLLHFDKCKMVLKKA